MFDPAVRYARSAVLVAMPTLGILWLLHVPFMLGFSIVSAAYLSVMAGLATACGLLAEPGKGGRAVLNLVLALVALGCWTWGGWHHEEWLVSFTRGPEKWLPGAIALLLLVEALRRTCGMAITIVVLACALYAFFGHHLPGLLEGAYTAPPRLVLYLFNDTNGVPGIVLGVAATIVLSFILLGAAMNEVGASAFFTDLAMAAMGRRRGGPAKVAVIASSLFGTISGSTIANIMTTGVITIPLMKRSGFPAHTSAGIEAVASNGGQLAPPVMGATAFLIAEFLQVPYREVVFAAALPALIYYIVLFQQIDAIAARLKIKTIDAEDLPKFGEVIAKGWLYILPLAYLIYMLFWTGASPGTAALQATVAMIVAGCIATRTLPGPRMLWNILYSAGTTLITIMLICAAAGIVIGALNLTGLGFLLTNALSHIGESMGIFVMLVLTALIAIFLGMGMPTAAVYIVLSIILAPALVRMGIAPMAAHLFIFYFGLLSMITPPVAIASYAAGAIAKASPWATGMAGMRLGIAAYFLPFLFCWDPALVGHGTAWETVSVMLNCVAAGYLLALAMSLFEGFHARHDGGRLIGLVALALVLIVGGQIIGPTHPAMILLALGVLLAGRGLRLWRMTRANAAT